MKRLCPANTNEFTSSPQLIRHENKSCEFYPTLIIKYLRINNIIIQLPKLFLVIILNFAVSYLQAQEILKQPFDSGVTLPTDWEIKAGGTYTSASGSGENIPSVKFSTSDNFIVTPDFTRANEFSFWLKGYSVDEASALLIYQYVNQTWVLSDSIIPISKSEKNITLPILQNATKLKFQFRKSAGNLAFDDLIIRGKKITEPIASVFTSKPSISGLYANSASILVSVNQPSKLTYVVFPDSIKTLEEWITNPCLCGIGKLCVASGQININEPLTNILSINGLEKGSFYSLHMYLSALDSVNSFTGKETILNFTTKNSSSDLFFSEFIRASGNNKAIEIFNPTTDSIQLSNYRIAYATNGGGWKTTYFYFKNGAKVAPNSAYVVLKSTADTALMKFKQANETTSSSVLGYTGNDARALQRSTDGGITWEIIDLFGNPLQTTDFTICGVEKAAAKHNLIRKAGIISGNTDWLKSAGTDSISSEWILKPLTYFDNLGKHILLADTCMHFTFFEVPGSEKPVLTDSSGRILTYIVYDSVDITNLKPHFKVPDGITVTPNPSNVKDFTNPIRFKFTAGNKEIYWIVSVFQDKGPIAESADYVDTGSENIIVTFNEGLRVLKVKNKGDLCPRVTLVEALKPGIKISCIILFNAGANILTVIPERPLLSEVRYTLQIDSITDSFGNLSSAYEFSFQSSLKQNSIPQNISLQTSVCPNPAQDFVKVEFQNSAVPNYVYIFDLNGKLKYSKQVNTEKYHTIQISDFKDGVYLLKISNIYNSYCIRFVKNAIK